MTNLSDFLISVGYHEAKGLFSSNSSESSFPKGFPPDSSVSSPNGLLGIAPASSGESPNGFPVSDVELLKGSKIINIGQFLIFSC